MPTLADELMLAITEKGDVSTSTWLRLDNGVAGAHLMDLALAERVRLEDDVERLEHILRLRDLLGLSLEDLQRVVEAEDAREALRREWHGTEDPATRLRIVDQALGHIATQLELVERRQAALAELESELREREALARRRRAELGG